MLGVDVSDYQPAGLPWAEWYAAGARVAVCRASIGFVTDGGYERFVVAAHAAGFVVGAYHAILGHAYYEPVRQALAFVRLIMPQIRFLVADIEAPGVSAADVLAFVDHVESHSTLPLLLYGNMGLENILGRDNPRYGMLGLWVADYGPGGVTGAPPAGAQYPHVPRVGRKLGWQFTGQGRLPPYAGNIDLSVWDEIPGETTLPTVTDETIRAVTALLGSAREDLNVAKAAFDAGRAKIDSAVALLPVVAALPAFLFKVRIIVPVLNIRSGPAATFADVGDAVLGQELSVYAVDAVSGWYKIDPAAARWVSNGAAYSARVV